MNPISVGDDLVERLRPKHIADEPLARAVVSQDQVERRRAVEAYLVANNDLKREAAARIIAVEAERDALAKRLDHYIAMHGVNIRTGRKLVMRERDRATKAEARIAVLEALVGRSFKDGVSYGTNVAAADADLAWQQSKARAALTPEPS